jgi:hypothetical protein
MENSLNNIIQEVETIRQGQSRQANLFKLLIGLGAVIGIAALGLSFDNRFSLHLDYLTYILAGFGLAVGCFFALRQNKNNFLSTFRNKLLKLHISQSFPDTTYSESFIPEQELSLAQMVSNSYSKYTGEDLISTQINGCKVEICQLKLTFHNKNAYLLAFGGEFAVIKSSNLNIATAVLIDCKNPYPQLGNLFGLTSQKSKSGKTQTSINPQIDDLYNTYAEDTAQIARVLSPEFLSWWEKTVQREKISLHLSPNAIYIGWHKGEKGDFLAVDIHQPVTVETLERLSAELRQKFDFISELLSFFQPQTNQ